MSVGRQVCHRMIDTAADMRRHAKLVAEFENSPDRAMLVIDLASLAASLEHLVGPILTF